MIIVINIIIVENSIGYLKCNNSNNYFGYNIVLKLFFKYISFLKFRFNLRYCFYLWVLRIFVKLFLSIIM